MRLIIAYFAFVAALLIALPAFGAHISKADAEPQAEEVETVPASANGEALNGSEAPAGVDIHAI